MTRLGTASRRRRHRYRRRRLAAALPLTGRGDASWCSARPPKQAGSPPPTTPGWYRSGAADSDDSVEAHVADTLAAAQVV
ncbi:hypothetical protein I553_3931 [Mycobacterium xenopi 4042]|uniref:Uncharacterized protein n=1 Tax=Mycobacterium xenopi 4042 TaxID=1299334 RepID=X8DK94_MYCXE|nr:hypothetical protein I553_3931 [Mycobacterium xenopi 4042]